MSLAQDLVRAVRDIRSKLNVPERKPVKAVVNAPDVAAAGRLRAHAHVLRRLADVEEASIGVGQPKPDRSAAEVVGQVQVFVPLADLIDLDEERVRLQERIAKLQQQREVVRKKLDNPNFVNKAPAEVVQRERERMAAAESQIAALEQNLRELT
jgi:valyl-tRNA synthetase